MTASATRVWTAGEALIKAGRPATALTLRSTYADSWLVLDAGDALVVSVLADLAGVESPVAVAIVVVERS